jgi:hypothetical protein
VKSPTVFALAAAALLVGCAALGPATPREQREATAAHPAEKLCNGEPQPSASGDGPEEAASLVLNHLLSEGCPL